MIGWLVDWLVGSFIIWMVVWLVGCLVGWCVVWIDAIWTMLPRLLKSK